jgi:hypothetical protein
VLTAGAQPGPEHEVREIFLWDLAGQPGYRLVHQLHLSQADLALVLFDSRSETDPFAGVRYWARALRQVERNSPTGKRAIRFLVAARLDGESVAVSPARVDEVVERHGFDQYFETSAKAGRNIDELAEAIWAHIPWAHLPRVVSNGLFLSIKAFLVAEKDAGRLLATPRDLLAAYRRALIALRGVEREAESGLTGGLADSDFGGLSGEAFLQQEVGEGATDDDLFGAFETCIGRVEAQGLIRALSFGGLVLLQPELLDAYAAAIVDAARSEPDGLGTIAEDEVRTAAFRMPDAERATPGDEPLLIIATVEELLRAEVGHREHTDAGTFLVFPSELTRDWPKAPELPQIATKFSFEGSIATIYATLVVRLSRSGRVEIDERWRTAATFTANTGGTCGIVVRGEDAAGEIGVFYSDDASDETRFQFEEFVRSHLERRATEGTTERLRLFACTNPECGEALTEGQVRKRRALGHDTIGCPVCEQPVSLSDWLEGRRELVDSLVPEMHARADREREREANVAVLEGKRATDDFDVFLCHNSQDKEQVKDIAIVLQERGILPWLDEWELRPGLPWQSSLEAAIESIKSAAVFVGPSGIGPWQNIELQAFLDEFVRRRCPVIPVLLPSATTKPALPVFLRGMTWVDFRNQEPNPILQLAWGITAERPPRL